MKKLNKVVIIEARLGIFFKGLLSYQNPLNVRENRYDSLSKTQVHRVFYPHFF